METNLTNLQAGDKVVKVTSGGMYGPRAGGDQIVTRVTATQLIIEYPSTLVGEKPTVVRINKDDGSEVGASRTSHYFYTWYPANHERIVGIRNELAQRQAFNEFKSKAETCVNNSRSTEGLKAALQALLAEVK